MTSARITEEDACYRARNLCVFSRIQKGTLGLTHKECILQRVSFGALSDVTVVLGMRQSIAQLCQINTQQVALGYRKGFLGMGFGDQRFALSLLIKIKV